MFVVFSVNSLVGPPAHHRRYGVCGGRTCQRTAGVFLTDEAARNALVEVEVVDVDSFCLEGEVEGACLVRYEEEEERAGTLLAAVARCNSYDAADYVPVRVGSEQVGWANGALLAALADQLTLGRTCAIEAREVRGLPMVTLVGGLAHAATLVEGVPTVGLQLAPGARSAAETTQLVAELVEGLVSDGFIPAAKIRNERQDVRMPSVVARRGTLKRRDVDSTAAKEALTCTPDLPP